MTSTATSDHPVANGKWYYEFELDGGVTETYAAGAGSRHRHRVEYLLNPVVQLFGGTLAGKRVLDLGCNAGLFMLAALDHGCDFACGVEGDAAYLSQAHQVFARKSVDQSRYAFLQTDVLTHLESTTESFDVVLCLGLAHHLPARDYFRLFEGISRCNADVLVVDTIMGSPRCGPLLQIHRKSTSHRQNEGAEIVIHPTPQGMVQLASAFGYHGVALRPTDGLAVEAGDYRSGGRRGFVFAKSADLACLDQDSVETDAGDLAYLPARAMIKALGSKLLRRIRGAR